MPSCVGHLCPSNSVGSSNFFSASSSQPREMDSKTMFLPHPALTAHRSRMRLWKQGFTLIGVAAAAALVWASTHLLWKTFWQPAGTATVDFEKMAIDLLDQNPLIDGHNDLMSAIRVLYKDHIYGKEFQQKFLGGSLELQTDIPRLRKGKVGGVFWSTFMPCPKDNSDFSNEKYSEVVRGTLQQIDLFHRLSEEYPEYFTPAKDHAEAIRNFKSARLIAPIAIEGLHQIGNSPSTLRLYHRLGVRYATLTWNCHNAYADSAVISLPNGTDIPSKPYWGGVSAAGRDIVREMNRLGMIVDLSHTSADTMRDVLQGSPGWNGSTAPVIFSHSSAYALCPHPRNVPDDVLHLVKRRKSLVMINFGPHFLSCTQSDSRGGMPEFYTPNATLHQVVRHIKHIGELVGYDHVGLGSDYDGIDTGPDGLNDVSYFPKLIASLLRNGISKEDCVKIMGGNLLRVWKDIDKQARRLQREIMPLEDEIAQPWI